MKNTVLKISLIVGLALIWIGIILGVALFLNSKRAFVAGQLNSEAAGKTGRDQLQYLEAANAIQPNDESRIVLTEALLEQGYFDGAKKYLDKISNSKRKRELVVFYEVSKGDYQDISSLEQPETALGQLLKAISSEDYRNLGNSRIAKEIPQFKNGDNVRLSLSEYFLKKHQIGVARYVALKENEKNPTKASLKQIVTTYELERNFAKALEWSNELVKVDPSDKLSYDKALDNAQRAGSDIDINHLKLQIFSLTNIQK